MKTVLKNMRYQNSGYFENQDANDYLILGKDSELLNKYFKKAKSNIFFFSTNRKSF